MQRTKMYFSGSMTHPDVVDRLIGTNVPRLFTFASPKEAPEYLELCDARGVVCDMIVDSGAFTAWSIGKPVRLEDLLAYDKKLSTKFPHHKLTFIALDVIPGERGRLATEPEIAAAIEKSYANFCTMQQELKGRTVLPVFHSGEGTWLRDKYLALTDYVCLSPNQNLSEQQRFRWASEVIVPGYKFHGLATTGNAMLSFVDWYSVDSSGWLMVAAMGAILIPYQDKLRPLQVSSTSPSRKVAGQHLCNIAERDYVTDLIRSRGYDPELLSTLYQHRICWNIDMWNNPPWNKRPVRSHGLF